MESDGAELISDDSSSDVEDIQLHSQGSLLPAVGWVGRREPWERGWRILTLKINQGTKFGTLKKAHIQFI